jgi:hypothetical protein
MKRNKERAGMPRPSFERTYPISGPVILDSTGKPHWNWQVTGWAGGERGEWVTGISYYLDGKSIRIEHALDAELAWDVDEVDALDMVFSDRAGRKGQRTTDVSTLRMIRVDEGEVRAAEVDGGQVVAFALDHSGDYFLVQVIESGLDLRVFDYGFRRWDWPDSWPDSGEPVAEPGPDAPDVIIE